MASCRRFYKLTCYRNTEIEDSECCGGTKVGHKYLNGIAFSSGGKLIALMERPYNVSDIGQIITIRDSYGEEFTFKASQTKYSHEELVQILNDCNFCGEMNDYVQSVTGDGVDNTDPQNPIVNIPDQVCSVQSYPTFAEFPDEPESCVLYIDESTKKQYIESGGAYLEVGSSENIYNTDGVLTGNRTVDLDGNNLTFSSNSGGLFRILMQGTNGYGDLSFGSGLIGFITHYNPTGANYGFQIIANNSLRIQTGQDLSGLSSADNYFLKLQGANGKVLYSKITADDIDDTTSVQKFVTQGEKDAIGSIMGQDPVIVDVDFTIDNTYKNKHIYATAPISQTITIPFNSSISNGSKFLITSENAECVNIVGDDVVILKDPNLTTILEKRGVVTIEKKSDDVWLAYGDLKSVPSDFNDKEIILSPRDTFKTPTIFGQTLYWLKVYKSSNWPELNITKDYFCIWSTDHDVAGQGGIFYAECDDPQLNGFTQTYKNPILIGYQIETPWLLRVPASESGISDEIFLFCHTDSNDPGNAGIQETVLYTTSGGGLPENVTWTHRGRPFGTQPGDDHTGYATVYRRGPNDYFARHQTVGFAGPFAAVSYSTDCLTFTRAYSIDTRVEWNGSFTRVPMNYEIGVIGGVRYGFCRFNKSDGSQWVAIATMDDDYNPTKLVKLIQTHVQVRSFSFYIEDNIAHFLIKGGASNSDTQNDYYSFKYDLSDLLNSDETAIRYNTGYLKAEYNTKLNLDFPIRCVFTPENSAPDWELFGKGIQDEADKRWFVNYVSGSFGLLTRPLQANPSNDYRFLYSFVDGETYEYYAEVESGTGDLVQYINGIEERRDASPQGLSITTTMYFFEMGAMDRNVGPRYFVGTISHFEMGSEVFEFSENYGPSTESNEGTKLYLKGDVGWDSCKF